MTTEIRASVCRATDLGSVQRARLEAMLAAGQRIRECYRVLNRTGANIVSEILRGEGVFRKWDHYPTGDIYDPESHSQYYYHSHRQDVAEHGHFHTFLRAGAIPESVRPVIDPVPGNRPSGEDMLTHLVAISMDKYGYPVELFTTNRWVTGECWYSAEDIIAIIDRFEIDHAAPSWPANIWITAMLGLFRPEIETLLRERDTVMARFPAVRENGTEVSRYEDHRMEVCSSMRISVDRQINRIRAELDRLDGS